ncbi:MAG: ABC transporter ATP-binding protein [Phototrophicaceae bacterium]|jgi:branched-chain amino acid transport system ATP-binding protein
MTNKTKVENAPLLQLTNVHSYYGNIHALQGVSLYVNEGEIVTLIGTNGAGKSTTIRTVSGIMQPREGEILFEGQPIQRVPAHELVKRGISQSPEGRRVFSRLTVEENLEMGAYTRNDRAEIIRNLQEAFVLFPRLAERRKQLAGTLSGGEQQMLAIGRALMANPRLLLLDEPSMGLAPVLVELIFETIQRINRERGITILLVEQNALMALEVAARGYVLQTGTVVMTDVAANLIQNEMIRQVYLGQH